MTKITQKLVAKLAQPANGQQEKASSPMSNDLAEMLREAIKNSGRTLYELSKLSGVDRGILSRFKSGDRDLSLKSATNLLNVLSLNLVSTAAGSKSYLPVVCFKDRSAARLDEKIANARKRVTVLTANVSSRSYGLIEPFVGAFRSAEQRGEDPPSISILAMDPESDHLKTLAGIRCPEDRDRKEFTREYKKELTHVLDKIARFFYAFEPGSKCILKTYTANPMQIWALVDDMIYVSNPSIPNNARDNCVFSAPITFPGVEQTFLGNFDALLKHEGTRDWPREREIAVHLKNPPPHPRRLSP